MTRSGAVPEPARIGITSIGSGVGQSVADACRISQLPLALYAYGNEPLAFGNFDCDHRRVLPTIYDTQYLEYLLEQCLADRIQCLIPGLDDELLPLAQLRDRFLAAGIYLPIASEPVLQLCRDKVAMSQVLNPIAGCFVESYHLAEAEQRLATGELGFPLIAKPIGGFASRGIKLLRSKADMAGLSSHHIVQTLALPDASDPACERVMDRLSAGHLSQDAEWSAQVVIGRQGRELGRFLSYNRLRGGVPVEIIPADSEAIWAAIDAFLPYLLAQGLTGPLNIQGRLTEQGPRFFEMNARYTGITGLRAMLGFNEVAAVIADALSLPVPVRLSPCSPAKVGLRQVANRVVNTQLLPEQAHAMLPRDAAQPSVKPRRILVTGARGFLGKALLNALLRGNDPVEVIALCRVSADAHAAPINSISSGPVIVSPQSTLRWIAWETLTSGEESIGQVDVICHLASARPGAGAAAFAESLDMTAQLVNLAVTHQVSALIFASSQAVYGTGRKPLWRESDPAAPETPYALHKFAGELQCRMLADLLPQCRVTSLRFAQLFGGSDLARSQEAPHAMLRHAVSQGYLIQQGGEQTLDLLSVDDAAAAMTALLRLPLGEWPECVNIGSGAPIRVADVVMQISQMVQRATGKPVRIDHQEAKHTNSFGMNTAFSLSRLGWQPAQTLQTALTPYLHALLAEPA